MLLHRYHATPPPPPSHPWHLCCHLDIWVWHLMWGHLKEDLEEMLTTAGVWSYRLFIWLSRTVSITASRTVCACGRGGVVSQIQKSKNKDGQGDWKKWVFEIIPNSTWLIYVQTSPANATHCLHTRTLRCRWKGLSLSLSQLPSINPKAQSYTHSSFSWYCIEFSAFIFLPQSSESLMDRMDFYIARSYWLGTIGAINRNTVTHS